MAYESERWRGDPGARDVMCNHCIHRGKYGIGTCTAFPDGIPRDLIRRKEHDTPFPGDNGIRFEPDNTVELQKPL